MRAALTDGHFPSLRAADGPAPTAAGRFRPGAVALSAALHGLAAALLLTAAPVTPPRAPEEAVPVEVWTAEQFAAIAPPAEQARPAAPQPPATPAAPSLAPSPELSAPPAIPEPPPARPTHETIRPATMLAAAVLAHPRSRGTVAFLKSLEADERFEQLCNLEAMAQIADAYPNLRPDRVIAYAFGPATARGDRLTAAGAAFHSRGDWINLSYACGATRDRTRTTAFEFEIGDPVPKRDWAARGLPPHP